MPDNRPAVTVLCEDRAHYRLVRGFLTRRGFDGRQIYPKQAPAGCGDAKAYVQKQYPVELQALRSGSVYCALVVVIDADNLSVAERKRFLESLLEPREKRKPEELVVHIVPKWQLENWLYYLDTRKVDEDRRLGYPEYTNHNSNPFAKRLHELCMSWNNGVPEDGVPPSLRDACHEWARFKSLL
ncbi:MAG: hypothetical protein HQL87_01630 [Magnetococcales bacterium]|nr:hypothetical protein [Magnetococcales bacterium]